MISQLGRPKTSNDVECVCGYCGIAYKVPEWSRSGRKYCSKVCVDAARRGHRLAGSAPLIDITCQECGKIYQQPPWKQTGKTFCSAECYHISRQGKIPAPPTSEHVTCRNCGLDYVVSSWQKTGRSYCSSKCYHEARTGSPLLARRIKPTPISCQSCGKEFLAGGRGRRRLGSIYCSAICQGEGQSKYPPLRQMTETEIAWLAGLFDGEGNIAWPRASNLHSVRISIANTNFALLDKVLQVTGTGSIADLRRDNPLHANAGNWACFGDRARDLLRIMLPWLIVKRENALIALRAVDEWRAGRRSTELPHHPRLAAKAALEAT